MNSKNVILSDNTETVVITSAKILKDAFIQWSDEHEKERILAKKEPMLSESAVRHRLGICHSTLWRWNACGYLICYKIGGRNCYKESDVERIEKGLVM